MALEQDRGTLERSPTDQRVGGLAPLYRSDRGSRRAAGCVLSETQNAARESVFFDATACVAHKLSPRRVQGLLDPRRGPKSAKTLDCKLDFTSDL